MKILVFDNYDSFTFNLVHLIEKVCGHEPEVYRNDKISLEEIGRFDKIVLSPGPGIPSEAGILLQVIKKFASTKSILGVCLGHQAIAEAFGGKLFNMDTVYHGVSMPVEVVKADKIFKGIPPAFKAGRYHSWMVDKNNLPACLEVTATDSSGNIIALRHKEFDVRGVQFHPESILTEFGEELMKNWIG